MASNHTERGDFFGGCDNLGMNNICTLYDSGRNDQERYIRMNSCGWASVDGTRGAMTLSGFFTGNGQEPTIPREQLQTRK